MSAGGIILLFMISPLLWIIGDMAKEALQYGHYGAGVTLLLVLIGVLMLAGGVIFL